MYSNLFKTIYKFIIYWYNFFFQTCFLCNQILPIGHKDYKYCSICSYFLNYVPKEGFFLNQFEAYCVFFYNSYVRQPILLLKHGNNIFMAKRIAQIIFTEYENVLLNCDYIVVVPVNWKKKLLKGFNHAELIGISLGKLSKKKCLGNVLQKTKNITQQGKSNDIRAEQTKDLFQINNKEIRNIRNKKIILFDDMITTGNTILRAAELLSHYCDVTILSFTISKSLLKK